MWTSRNLPMAALAFGFLLPLVIASLAAAAEPSQAKGAADLEHSSVHALNDDVLQAEEEFHLTPARMLSVYKLIKDCKNKGNKQECKKAKELKKREKRRKRKIRGKRFPRVPRQRSQHWAPPPPPKPKSVYKKPSPPPLPKPAPRPRPSPPPHPASGVTAIHKSYLDPHNVARANKGLAPLTWDSSLESYARSWGIHQRDTDNCDLQHSNGPYGENLFWGWGYPYGAVDAVNSWTEEEPFYHYNTNTCDPGQMCGHYTQVVWKSTTKLGCANINCKDGSIFIICSYNPPGNYIGERPY